MKNGKASPWQRLCHAHKNTMMSAKYNILYAGSHQPALVARGSSTKKECGITYLNVLNTKTTFSEIVPEYIRKF